MTVATVGHPCCESGTKHECPWHTFVSECEEESTLIGGTSREKTREHNTTILCQKSQSDARPLGWGDFKGGGVPLKSNLVPRGGVGGGASHERQWALFFWHGPQTCPTEVCVVHRGPSTAKPTAKRARKGTAQW